jgi:hypothetical protein
LFFMATTPKKRSKKSKVTRTASRVESLSQLKKTIATQAQELQHAADQPLIHPLQARAKEGCLAQSRKACPE